MHKSIRSQALLLSMVSLSTSAKHPSKSTGKRQPEISCELQEMLR
jgi:hypothetical protein